MKRTKNSKKGFTLIELIVVIAILAILAAIAIPRLAGFTENARQADDEEIAAVVASAAAMYAASHEGESGWSVGNVTLDNLSTDGLIKKSYVPADLTSTRYDNITLTYSTAVGATVTLNSTVGPNYVIIK